MTFASTAGNIRASSRHNGQSFVKTGAELCDLLEGRHLLSARYRTPGDE